MPIGAVIGGAVIGAGGSIIAGSKSASAQKQAAQTAATSAQSTTDSNNALFRENKAQNIAIAQPFYNNGVAAGNALQGLLLGSPTSASSPAPGTTGGALSGYQQSSPAGQYPNAVGDDSLTYGTIRARRLDMMDAPQAALTGYQRLPADTQTPVPGTTPAPAMGTTTSALSPWDQFRNSTNYQFRYDQGLKATEGAYATKGALDSGAAEKAKITFGQNFASNELSNYMNLLAGQQNVGLSAGNAIMGVSTSAANAIAGQNTNAGNVAANAALTSGQASANMWGTVGNTAGQLGGALFQYGMGQMKPSVPSAQSINVTPNWQSNYPATGYGGIP
jgi:hypothetical protein